MKILNTKQIKALDAFTIEHEPITSIDLMERACEAFVTWLTERYHAGNKIGIVCGTGNNGGDGLGIARLLNECGYTVKVWIVRGEVPDSADFKLNLSRIVGKIEINEIISDADKGLFTNLDILIDGIFGSGLSRPAQGIYKQAIACINASAALRVAIDIPSGLMVDAHSQGEIVKAHITITFQLPKLAFLMPGNHQYVGQWLMVDIGLRKDFIQKEQTPYIFLQRKNIRKLLKTKSTFDHKGSNGKALLVCGEIGKMGAAVLSSRGALRAGVGLLTIHAPRCGYTILQTAVPEAMVSIDKEENLISDVLDIDSVNAIGIGPGIGTQASTLQALSSLLRKSKVPLVIDADALNLIAENRELLNVIPAGSILTPHPKEFERLVGSWLDDFSKLELLKTLAKEINGIVILKGAYTAIASPTGKIFFNSTGNPGMAKGGSGDVLTGVLTGLLAQGYEALEASKIGVFIHGMAGDMAARDLSEEGIISSDIIEYLPHTFRQIMR